MMDWYLSMVESTVKTICINGIQYLSPVFAVGKTIYFDPYLTYFLT